MVNLDKPNDGASSSQSVNDQFNQQFSTQNKKLFLPNAIAVLVLGIISIVGCFVYGVPGLICGIIALVKAGKAAKLLQQNPDGYTPGSIKNLKAGKTCAVIGTCCSALYIIVLIIVLVVALASSDPYSSSYYNY